MRVSITQSKYGLALWGVALTAVVWAALAPAVARPPQKASITPADVEAAQDRWCKGLLEIGESYRRGGETYKEVANRFIDDLYDYREGAVFFKPTYAFGEHTFRTTKEGALSYFIKGIVPTDEGFALKHWTRCRYANNAGIQIHGDLGIAMGNVCLTDAAVEGPPVVVDQTFVFRKGRDGKLRLRAHHSSVPYKAPIADPCGKSSPVKSGSASGTAG